MQFAMRAAALGALLSWLGICSALPQGTDAPPHWAGQKVYQGPNFSIHTLSIAPIRKNEYCVTQNNTLVLQAVFDVPDDFELGETYLASVLPWVLLARIAAQVCPNPKTIITAHYFKDRFIDDILATSNQGADSQAALAVATGGWLTQHQASSKSGFVPSVRIAFTVPSRPAPKISSLHRQGR